MYQMQKTQKNEKGIMRQMPIWSESKPRGCPQTLSRYHPLVKLFNWMRDRGLVQFASYEDYIARRNDPAPKVKSNLAVIEAMERDRVSGIKKINHE